MSWWTMADIKKANKKSGRHFFDEAAKSFFDSEIYEEVYQGEGGIYFVTSEQYKNGPKVAPRKFTVREFNPKTCGIESVTDFNSIETLKEARAIARKYANGVMD